MIADLGRPDTTELPYSQDSKERTSAPGERRVPVRQDDVSDGGDAVGRSMMTSLSLCVESC